MHIWNENTEQHFATNNCHSALNAMKADAVGVVRRTNRSTVSKQKDQNGKHCIDQKKCEIQQKPINHENEENKPPAVEAVGSAVGKRATREKPRLFNHLSNNICPREKLLNDGHVGSAVIQLNDPNKAMQLQATTPEKHEPEPIDVSQRVKEVDIALEDTFVMTRQLMYKAEQLSADDINRLEKELKDFSSRMISTLKVNI